MAFTNDSVVSWFLIGKVFNGERNQNDIFETGWAIDNENGKLTNDALLRMTDNQLEAIGFSSDGSINTEHFR